VSWQLATIANTAIAAAYFAIAWLIGSGLARTNQVATNRLGLATALIFFSCGMGHGLHATHLAFPSIGLDERTGLPLREGFDPHMIAWDFFTAGVAFWFLALRKSYGRLLLPDSPVMFEDQERIRVEEEANRLKDEFLGSVSHELRTPLASIRGYSELLMEGDTHNGDNRRQFLEVIDRNARRLERLVGDILLISKAESGSFEIEREAMNLNELLVDSVDAARPEADQKGIHLSLRVESVVECSGDPQRLAQVFDNVISNAIKYTGEGGRVDVELTQDGGRALIQARDTGIGISPEDQQELFVRFYRASNATSRGIPGLGLGLTIVKAIVDAHGGSVSLESKDGAGTTVRIELPAGERTSGDLDRERPQPDEIGVGSGDQRRMEKVRE